MGRKKKAVSGGFAEKGSEGEVRVSAPGGYEEMTPEQRRTTTILGASIVAVIVVVIAVVIGVVTWQKNKTATETAQKNESAYSKLADDSIARPSDYVTRDGAIQFTRDGVVKGKLDDKWKDTKTVDVWLDPLCPGCGSVDQTLSPTYAEYLQSGKIVLRIHPIATLDSLSTDDYSTRASASMYRMLDVAPDKAYAYITLLMSEDKQPEEGNGYESVSDADLQKTATEVGVDEKDAESLTDGKYKEYLKAATDYSTSRTELYRSDTGEFATPIVRVGDTNMSFDDPSTSKLIEQFKRLVDKTDK